MPNEPKHTPPPWKAIQGHDGDPNRWIVVQDGETPWIIAVIENGVPGDFLHTEEANAKLFAATPDLLELSRAGYALSAYAASIHWGENDTNTADWLEGLREHIENYQSAYEAFLKKRKGEDNG